MIAGVIPARDGKGPRYLIQGQGDLPFLRMNSNSYLGLALNARVKAAEDEAVRRYGSGPGAVRFISGTWAPHVALELRLAAFHLLNLVADLCRRWAVAWLTSSPTAR